MDARYILQAPGFWTESSQKRLGHQPNGVHPHPPERKMPPRIDERQMSHFHL